MISSDLQILTVKNLLVLPLGIPIYQRPYRWSTDSAALLFNDIYESFQNKCEEYRIGTVVLHKNEKSILMIVDGQQRLTTLSLLLYAITRTIGNTSQEIEKCLRLLNQVESYNALSVDAVRDNYEVLEQKCRELEKEELEEFSDYLLNNCTFVKIVTKSEQQAFQFFDSQNSRGKELAPHDLLKSYHLREMNNEKEEEKRKLINTWEKENQEWLARFFANHLYPLTKWYKGNSGKDYSVSKIKTFKGIKPESTYSYAKYHKAANFYIEGLNPKEKNVSQFQLTQPLIGGRRFFEFTLHYLSLYHRCVFIFEKENFNSIVNDSESGNGYVRNMFINVLMFFIDKFGEEALTQSILKKLYKWAYSLRLVMYSVYIETVNNYARGLNDRANHGLNMFYKISEMTNPNEMDGILLQTVKYDDCKYSQRDDLWEDLFGGGNE